MRQSGRRYLKVLQQLFDLSKCAAPAASSSPNLRSLSPGPLRRCAARLAGWQGAEGPLAGCRQGGDLWDLSYPSKGRNHAPALEAES